MNFSNQSTEHLGRKIVADFCGYLPLFAVIFYFYSTVHSTEFKLVHAAYSTNGSTVILPDLMP